MFIANEKACQNEKTEIHRLNNHIFKELTTLAFSDIFYTILKFKKSNDPLIRFLTPSVYSEQHPTPYEKPCRKKILNAVNKIN